MIRVGLAAALCAAMGLLSGCQRAAIAVGQARLSVNGRVLMAAPGQAYHRATAHRMHDGDRVKVLTGTASLTFHDGASLELAPGAELRFATAPVLLAGRVLAVSGSTLDVLSAGSRVRLVNGAARIQRDLAVTVGTYRGTVNVESGGRTLSVPALRQATVVSLGLIPNSPSPLSYTGENVWDRRYLGVAIELTDQLEARSKGFTSVLSSGDGKSVGFYRVLLPSLAAEPQFGTALLDVPRPPGETLVGASLTIASRRGSFAQRWAQVFAFRDEGATWGLVAMDQAVTDVVKVTGGIDAAIGRAPVFANSPTFPVAAPALSSTTPTTAPLPTARQRSVPGSSKAPTPTTVPNPQLPAPVLPTPTTGTPLDGLIDPLTETVNQLLGVLN